MILLNHYNIKIWSDNMQPKHGKSTLEVCQILIKSFAVYLDFVFGAFVRCFQFVMTSFLIWVNSHLYLCICNYVFTFVKKKCWNCGNSRLHRTYIHPCNPFMAGSRGRPKASSSSPVVPAVPGHMSSHHKPKKKVSGCVWFKPIRTHSWVVPLKPHS